jgi:hypothetical protein
VWIALKNIHAVSSNDAEENERTCWLTPFLSERPISLPGEALTVEDN